MPSTKTNLPLFKALPTAERLCSELADTCERIELAGSIRRQRSEVGDIEIVAIPIRCVNLLGDVDDELPTRLEARLGQWERDGRIAITKFGPKMKQFTLKLSSGIRISVDISVTTAECWPVILAIRTGPWQYSKAFVTQRAKAGLLQNGCHVSEGRLYQDGRLVELRDERHFFEFVQGGYLPPENRK